LISTTRDQLLDILPPSSIKLTELRYAALTLIAKGSLVFLRRLVGPI